LETEIIQAESQEGIKHAMAPTGKGTGYIARARLISNHGIYADKMVDGTFEGRVGRSYTIVKESAHSSIDDP